MCGACWSSLLPWDGPFCLRCGLPFASLQVLDSAAQQCGACLDHEPAFDKARSFGLYTGRLRRSILQLKFAHRESLGRRLGELLVTCWDALEELPGETLPMVVPVPLHASRQRERGFNQAQLLAAGLVRVLRQRNETQALKVSNDCLRRIRATPPQTGLSLAARRENLQGAFESSNAEKVHGCTVVLIDDVMTTGSTLSACARALKRAGPLRVIALTLARATPQFPDLATAEGDLPVDGPHRDST